MLWHIKYIFKTICAYSLDYIYTFSIMYTLFIVLSNIFIVFFHIWLLLLARFTFDFEYGLAYINISVPKNLLGLP